MRSSSEVERSILAKGDTVPDSGEAEPGVVSHSASAFRRQRERNTVIQFLLLSLTDVLEGCFLG